MTTRSSHPLVVMAVMAVLGATVSTGSRHSAMASPTETASWMDEKALTETFSGKTIQGQYASGKPFTETYFGHGGIDYVEQTRQFAGHWSVQGRAFCTIYHRDGTGGCYQVRQVGENCYEFYFVARTEFDAANAITVPPAWTARAAVSDRTSSCDERPAV